MAREKMKRALCLVFCICMLFALTGCHSDLKAELQTVIDTQIGSEDTYTPNSYDNYLSALSDAEAVKEKSIVTAQQIKDAKSNLETALEELYVKPDKTELKQKLDEANQLDKSKYLPNSTATLVNAIEESTMIFEDDNAIAEDVQRAITVLAAGTDALAVKPDKSGLENLLSKAKSLDKNKYTTVSVEQLETAITSTTATMNNENATSSDVDAAQKSLQTTLDNMVKATKGVYKITCSLSRLATNHVGNEWSSGITYNGKTIHSGDTITASLNGSITIKGTAVEHDSIPDSGSGSVTIPLSGGEKSTQFYVRENRGRYSGNLAVWELTCSAMLIERI